MTQDDFFTRQTEQSQVKAEIVAKYFDAWANVIIPSAKKHSRSIGYVDLFAGPGRYADDSPSTPLLVLEKAIGHPDMRDMLRAVFNDKDPENSRKLQQELDNLPNIDRLKHKPTVENLEVDEDLAQALESITLIPCLSFVDPWGYKGVTLSLIQSLIRNWGCDCVLFFNYLRVNMHIPNPTQAENIDALFGEERAQRLRRKVQGLGAWEREMTVIEELAGPMQDIGAQYVLPYCFKNTKGERTSHHLVFVSKHVLGYEIMKGIMAGYSSESPQGVPSFEYSPVNTSRYPVLFELARPLDELGEMLLDRFSGQTLTMKQIYEQHHVGRPYIKKNYKSALVELEEEGKIAADPPALERPTRDGQRTFADRVVVTFL